ncbi:MAG: PQQ-like beta-propeller repeat protein [Candidatus Treponema excrementipullorum]|uniref:PQQ-like beta-propeller repeat protein n=1 Tax=Candidatus Treponema excrementipullorum TaxID=2838768 RepID=A0A9E2NYX6_9SPIR|nr:PQQ-like beta-propeller repeat protein [Candidatus Treponema excrementipullorum]
MKKIFCLVFIFLFVSFFYAEESEALQPNWQLVVGGAPIAPPIITDFGFAVPLDGRTMAAVSETGQLMWFATLPGYKTSPHYTMGTGDFLIAVSGGNKLSLINPSGLTLWSSTAPAEILSTPLQGRDGRIYLQCTNQLACFGIGGTLKWTLPVENISTLPLTELEDGSVLCLLNTIVDGCSTAVRVSPFGEILEEITFTSVVAGVKQSKFGTILIFTDGSLGICSSTDNMAVTRWSIPALVSPSVSSVPSQIYLDTLHTLCAVVTASGSQSLVTVVDLDKGEKKFNVSAAINLNDLQFGTIDLTNIVLCDSQKALGLSLDDGVEVWNSDLPGKLTWDYLLYTPKGYIITLEKKSWLISAYRVTQTIGSQQYRAYKSEKTNYPVYIELATKKANIPQNDSEVFMNLIPPDLEKTIYRSIYEGNYGTSEAQWQALVTRENTRCLSNSKSVSQNPMASYDITYKESIIKLMGAFESSCFNRNLAQILQQETDISLLRTALRASAKIAYDPNLELLSSIELLLGKTSLLSNYTITTAICNAVYEICRFMGKPALFSRGRYILSYLLNQKLDSKTKDYAVYTLQKLISLEM